MQTYDETKLDLYEQYGNSDFVYVQIELCALTLYSPSILGT